MAHIHLNIANGDFALLVTNFLGQCDPDCLRILWLTGANMVWRYFE